MRMYEGPEAESSEPDRACKVSEPEPNHPMENLAESFPGLAPRFSIEFIPETDPRLRLPAGGAARRRLRRRPPGDIRAMIRQTLLDRDLRDVDRAGEDPRPDPALGRLIARLARTPIYPLLLAGYPILTLFAQNAREVP